MSTLTTKKPRAKRVVLSDEEVLEVYELGKQGLSDYTISQRTGHTVSAVRVALARVDPYGRVMTNVYGHASNNPSHARTRKNNEICLDEVPFSACKTGNPWTV